MSPKLPIFISSDYVQTGPAYTSTDSAIVAVLFKWGPALTYVQNQANSKNNNYQMVIQCQVRLRLLVQLGDTGASLCLKKFEEQSQLIWRMDGRGYTWTMATREL
jgi:hypothetical protein